ncbi:MAG: hypothetical protein ACXIVL_02845 [Oceanicaulis sp.]
MSEMEVKEREQSAKPKLFNAMRLLHDVNALMAGQRYQGAISTAIHGLEELGMCIAKLSDDEASKQWRASHLPRLKAWQWTFLQTTVLKQAGAEPDLPGTCERISVDEFGQQLRRLAEVTDEEVAALSAYFYERAEADTEIALFAPDSLKESDDPLLASVLRKVSDVSAHQIYLLRQRALYEHVPQQTAEQIYRGRAKELQALLQQSLKAYLKYVMEHTTMFKLEWEEVPPEKPGDPVTSWRARADMP